jgi:integrase
MLPPNDPFFNGLLWFTLAGADLAAGACGAIRVQPKTINERFRQAKTKVNRVAPIRSALRAWLDRYASRPSISGWPFPSLTGYHYDIDNLSHHLAAANHKAGLPWTCLDYRHTFGSQLAMKGESLVQDQQAFGLQPRDMPHALRGAFP